MKVCVAYDHQNGEVWGVFDNMNTATALLSLAAPEKAIKMDEIELFTADHLVKYNEIKKMFTE